MTPIEQHLGLSQKQLEKLRHFQDLLLDVNRRHNLISDASGEHAWDRHIRHSLALATRQFPRGCTVVDWGTGGGLPAIPLAIVFPEARFVGVDSVGKKIRSVALMARRLDLANLEVWHGRAEEWTGTAHYAVSRATAPLVDLWGWTRRVLSPVETGAQNWKQGLLTLKGGELDGEISALRAADPATIASIEPLEGLLASEYFSHKVIVHVMPGDSS